MTVTRISRACAARRWARGCSDLTIKRPAYVGDTIHVVVEVTQARAASSGQRGVVTTRNSVRNQRGEDVLIYTPVRLIRGRGYHSPGQAS